MEQPIAATGLTKTFGDFTAVNRIELNVRPGESFAMLGPNGAGKSSTMRMVSTVSPVTGGTLRIFGLDPAHDGPAIRNGLGVVAQENNLDEELSVVENIVLYGRYFGLSWKEARAKATELLGFAQLEDRADARVTSLSGGMKRRLAIARALCRDVKVLLLDEPFIGLDVVSRSLIADALDQASADERTTILTTHSFAEAEQCDLVMLMANRCIAFGPPSTVLSEDNLREAFGGRFVKVGNTLVLDDPHHHDHHHG